MTIVRGSITHRKARVNVESDLLVSNTDQLTITAPAATIESISFSFEKKANTGVLFTRGATVVNVSDIDSNINAKAEVVINSDGFIYIDGNKGAAHTFDFTVAGNFIVGNGGGSNENFVIGNLAFYGNARALTQLECFELYSKIGLIPFSLWEDNLVLNHWPLTERYGYDDGVNNVFFDVVEQYNNEKVTPLAPNHAKAINFTDAELGVADPSTQSVKFDFYNKQINRPWSMKFNGVNQYLQQSPLTNNIVTTNRDNLTLYQRLDEVIDTATTQIPLLFRNGTSVSFNFQFNVSINNIELSAELDGSTGKATFAFSDWGKPLSIFGFKLTEDPSGWYLYINGKKYLPTGTTGTHGTTSTEFTFNQLTIGGAFSGAGTFDFKGACSEIALWDRLLSEKEVRQERINGTLPTSSLLERVFLNKTPGSTIETFAANTLSLNGFTLAEYNEYFVEGQSLFNEIKETLLHETGISIGAAYTSIVGMGFTIQLQTDIAALSEIITGLPTITGFHVNGVSVSNEAAVVSALNLNQLIHIDLEWASASPTITFVHSGEDYYLIRDYYLKQQLSKLEKKKLTNNIFFSNPATKIFKQKFNYYALHNARNYVEGASNPENVPKIDVDTIGNRESLGWTGATAADKLADLVANIVLINSLR